MRGALWKQIAAVFVVAVILSFLTASLFSDDTRAVDADSGRAITPDILAQSEAVEREFRRQAREAMARERDRSLAVVAAVPGSGATMLGFVKRLYWLDAAAKASPFHVLEMWHDGRFTYLRTDAAQRLSLYEQEEPGGGGVLLPLGMYPATEGLYVVDGVAQGGWMQIGNDWARWRLETMEDGR